ncbi:DUF2334 domain-containing protein [soil metagenome]
MCGRWGREVSTYPCRPQGDSYSGLFGHTDAAMRWAAAFGLFVAAGGLRNGSMTGAAANPSLSIFAPAAAAAPRRALIVSLHDVAPRTRETCERIVQEIARCGVDACSLLVVPDYHHSGASMADREFVRWLRQLEDAGHEVVIHGYFHQRPRGEREKLGAQLLTRLYTKDEGEFYDLPYEEALRRISTAREEFTAAGLRPRGFIAPAWLLGPEAERAAADAEMEYTTRLTTIRDLRTGQDFQSRSMVYSTRAEWRRVMSLGWNWTMLHLLRDVELVRLGIHPPDRMHHNIWGQITRSLEQLTEVRNCTTYEDWVAERRDTSSPR